MLTIMYANIIFSRKRGLTIAGSAAVSYTSVALLEYFEAIPHHDLFNLGLGLHKDLTFVVTTLVVAVGIFLFLGYHSGIYGHLFRQRGEESIEKAVMLAKRAIELKEAQEHLARSEERYRVIFEHAGDSIALCDTDDTVLLWNKRAEEVFGWKAGEVVGKKWYLGIPQERREESKWLSREVMEKGLAWEHETERIAKDGRIVPVEVTRSALKDKEGRIFGMLHIARDISERKRLEREREKAQQKLIAAERLSAIGEMATVMGHELRNPLGVISNSVYYLKMKLSDAEEKVKRHLETIEEEVATSQRIMSELLDFA